MNTKNKSIFAGVLVVAALVMLAGCGIKPGQLSPPGGKGAPTFPGTYPQD